VSRRRVDAAERIRQMLDTTSDDTAAAHTRLPDGAAIPAADWPRRPTREQLLNQVTARVRRRGLGMGSYHAVLSGPQRRRGNGLDR